MKGTFSHLLLIASGSLVVFSCTTPEKGRTTRSGDSSVVTELGADSGVRVTGKAAGAQASATSKNGDALTTLDANPENGSTSIARRDSSIPSPTRTNFRCGIKGTPVLTDLGIGNLQVGRTIAVVKQTCRVLRDLQEETEGMPERVVTVMIADQPVRVTVLNGLVWRIALTSPSLATRDGLRVGTPLSRLVSKGKVKLSEGEDGLYVTVDSHCGLSFRYSIPSRETPGKQWTVPHVVARHGSEPADRILVTRCNA